MIEVKLLLILLAALGVSIFFYSKIFQKGNDIERKIFGIIMLVGGAVLGGFGFAKMNNYEYQFSKLLAEVGGSQYLDYSPIAIVITGIVIAVLGLILLAFKNKKSSYKY